MKKSDMAKSQKEKNYKEMLKEKFKDEDSGVWDPLGILSSTSDTPAQPEDQKPSDSGSRSARRGRPKKESPVSSDGSIVKTSIAFSRADYRMLNFFKTAVLDETGKSLSFGDIFAIAFRDSLDHELKRHFPESVELVKMMEKTVRK